MKKIVKLFLILVMGLVMAFSGKCYAETYQGYEVAGEIEIPAIKLNSKVLDKVTKSGIEVAPAIIYGTGLNKIGNTVIIGLNYKDGTLFSDLLKVNKEDIIYVKDVETGNRVAYKVYNTFIATPDDISYYDRDTLGTKEITLSTTTDDAANRFIVCAKETEEIKDNGQYKLANIEPVTVGANKYVAKIGDKVTAEVGLVNQQDGTSKEIDKSKLKIEVSNPDLVTNETDGTIKAKAEGTVKIKYTYADNEKTYEYSEEKFIISDKFATGDIPAISNTQVNLKVGNFENVSINMVQGGTYAVTYPDGFDASNYYKYDWNVENNQIAKIEKIHDAEVKISAVAKGSTKVICTITTADGKESFKKIITVTVTDEGNGTQVSTTPTSTPASATTITTNTVTNTQKVTNQTNTTSPNELPKAGLVYGITIFIMILSIVGIICYLKYRNIDK